MSYTVWRWHGERGAGVEEIVLSDIPTKRLAERLVINLGSVYDDFSLWIEED